MITGPFAKWDFYPRYLNQEEVNNPLLVIKDFFSAGSLPGHLEILKEWRTFVLEDRFYNDEKNNPSSLLFTHKINIQLIEAAYLLLQLYNANDNKSTDKNPVIDDQNIQVQKEKAEWLYFPDNLEMKQLLNPYLVLEECFKGYSLPAYRAYLDEWLEAALSSSGAGEFLNAQEIIEVYENLQKLYSAAWVIRQRELEPLAKSTVKQEKENNRDTPNSEGQPTLISQVISKIKHKVPSTAVIIHLGGMGENLPAIYLLVITSNQERKQGHELSSTIEESCKPFASVIALVHNAVHVTNAVAKNNFFFCNALLNHTPVYLSGEFLLPKPAPVDYILVKQRAASYWQHWYGQGDDQLNAAAYFFNIERNALAAFCLHQSAENVLVAIIGAILGYHIHVHNLSRLLRITQIFINSLSGAFELDTEQGVQLFTLLQNAYNHSRYKEDFKPDDESLEQLLKTVTFLTNSTKRIYEEWANSGNPEI